MSEPAALMNSRAGISAHTPPWRMPKWVIIPAITPHCTTPQVSRNSARPFLWHRPSSRCVMSLPLEWTTVLKEVRARASAAAITICPTPPAVITSVFISVIFSVIIDIKLFRVMGSDDQDSVPPEVFIAVVIWWLMPPNDAPAASKLQSQPA